EPGSSRICMTALHESPGASAARRSAIASRTASVTNSGPPTRSARLQVWYPLARRSSSQLSGSHWEVKSSVMGLLLEQLGESGGKLGVGLGAVQRGDVQCHRPADGFPGQPAQFDVANDRITDRVDG